MTNTDDMFPGETVRQYINRMKADNPSLIHPVEVEILIKKAFDRIHQTCVDVHVGTEEPREAAKHIVDDLVSEIEYITREDEKYGDAEVVARLAVKVDELREAVNNALLAISEALKGVE